MSVLQSSTFTGLFSRQGHKAHSLLFFGGWGCLLFYFEPWMVSISNLSILDEVSFVSYAMALLLLYSRMSFFWCFQGQVTFTLTQQFIFVGRPDTEAMELITKKKLKNRVYSWGVRGNYYNKTINFGIRKKRNQIKDKCSW